MARTLLGLLLLATPCAAHAQATEVRASDDAEARSLFEAGAEAFSNGRFERALEYFERSYELSHRPELLFNIGTAADRLRLDARALAAFEAYLEAAPDAENAAMVRARIAALERVLAEREEPWRWVLWGGSSALVLTGLGLLIGSEVDAASVRNAQDGTPWRDVADAYERAPILGATGWITLAVGALGAGVAVALFAMESGRESGGLTAFSLRVGLGSVAFSAAF